MPRQERTKSGTGIYHVMLRGINKQDIFEDDEDYLQMTSCLQGLTERYDVVSVEGMTVEIRKPLNTAYAGYDAWAEQHKEDTGEDISFF